MGTSPGLTGILFWLNLQSNANDSSTNAYNWTENGTISHPAGKVGNSAELGPPVEYLSIADAAWQTPSGSFTIAMWYKPVDATPASNAGIFNKYDTSSQRAILITQNTAGTTSFVISNNGTTPFTTASTATLSDGVWSSLVYVFTSSTSIQIYVDGVAQSANTTSIPAAIHNSTAGMQLGVYSAVYATGEYDSFCMYSTAWTAQNVTWFHNSGAGRQFSDL